MAEELFVARSEDLTEGARVLVKNGKAEVGVYRMDGRLIAYHNMCPHQGGPACEGLLMPKVKDVLGPHGTFVQQDFDHDEMHIVCPWHGWEFSLKTGVAAGDRTFRLRTAEVKETDGKIYVVV